MRVREARVPATGSHEKLHEKAVQLQGVACITTPKSHMILVRIRSATASLLSTPRNLLCTSKRCSLPSFAHVAPGFPSIDSQLPQLRTTVTWMGRVVRLNNGLSSPSPAIMRLRLLGVESVDGLNRHFRPPGNHHHPRRRHHLTLGQSAENTVSVMFVYQNLGSPPLLWLIM
jgi:hypothetical protein